MWFRAHEFESSRGGLGACVKVATKLDAQSLLEHYNVQLERAGWQKHDGDGEDDNIFSSWTFQSELFTSGSGDITMEPEDDEEFENGENVFRVCCSASWIPSRFFQVDRLVDPFDMDAWPAQEP
jgi:hypothetical protein